MTWAMFFSSTSTKATSFSLQGAAHAVAAHARCADYGHAQLVGRRPLGQHEGPAGDARQHAADRGRRTFEKTTS